MAYTQKHTWIFYSPQRGWTESLYLRPQTQTITFGQSLASQYATARAQMLGNGYGIKGYRVQQVEDVAGNKVKFVGDTVQRVNYPGTSGQPGAQVDLALLLDCINGTVTKHKPLYLGGIWDVISQNGGQYVPEPTFEVAFTNWLSKVVQFGYGWYSRTPSIQFTITGFTADADAFVTYTCSGTPFAGLGSAPFKVGVSGLPAIGGRSVLNGDQMVTRVTDSTCRTVQRIATTPFVGTGRLVTYTNNFQEIANIGIEKVVSRERGAPLLESPGRRRNRPRT